MCVIAIMEKTRATADMVRRMYRSNQSGGGGAWRETIKGKVVVKWSKGLTEEEMVDLAETLPIPHVLHFRIPTCGGALPELCHPFPINEKMSNALTGTTTDYVLFHNGHWSDWKKLCLQSAADHKIVVPAGRWSDTRAMAWFAAHFGLYSLDFIDEKAVAFGPAEIELFGGPWMQTTENKDIWVSNKGWESSGYGRHVTHNLHICWHGNCQANKTEGNYCAAHQDKAPGWVAPKVDTSSSVDRTAGGPPAKDPFRGTGTDATAGEAVKEAVSQGSQETRSASVPLTDTIHLTPQERMIAWSRKFNPRAVKSSTPPPVTLH